MVRSSTLPKTSSITHSRITYQPHSFQSGELRIRYRNQQRSQSETMFARPTITTPTITHIYRLWELEIFNGILAIATLGAIYGIVQHYGGQRIPDWDIPMNLNSLIAFLTFIFRVSLVFVLSEIIGQAKWNYFIGNTQEDPPMRRLIETSSFSDASQGLWGALKLIPTIIRFPDVLLAVLVLITSLGTGSFVQQAIQTQSCQFSTNNNAFYQSLATSLMNYMVENGVHRIWSPLYHLTLPRITRK